MCQMIGREQTATSRTTLRGELADYLLARIRIPWMQDLMAGLIEISNDDLDLDRSGGAADEPNRSTRKVKLWRWRRQWALQVIRQTLHALLEASQPRPALPPT